MTEAHNYENGVCEDCAYEHASHAFVYSNKTETGHTGTCSVCGKTVTEAHNYENGVCEDCAYEHVNHAFEYSNKTETGHTGTCSVCGKVVTEAHTYANGACEDCEYEHLNHDFGAYEKTESGHSQTCTVCGKTVMDTHHYANGFCEDCTYQHQDHIWGFDYTCTVCGAKRPLYTVSEDGTKIYFGEYPQTEVTDANDSDKSLRNSLNMDAGVPSAENRGEWTDYGYYIEGAVQSYMWYIDVEYQDSRYRGVYFTSYRPCYTAASSSTDNSYQDDNGYYINTAYWFKYEPIEWRILEEKDGTALLMANIILDSQQYYHTDSGTRTVGGKTVYPNNYKESDIRAWLNGTFYETAFDEYAQEIIETTAVDNSASTTASSYNPYACENTQDKVFLLSYKEAATSSYGFNPTTRQLKSTDYAKSQGVIVAPDIVTDLRGNGWWWLRSPSGYDSYDAYIVFGGGSLGCAGNGTNNYVYSADGGVVPVLRIRL